MSTNGELKKLAEDFAASRISRRDLWKGAAALGLSGMWIAALERGATAAPGSHYSALRQSGQDDKASTLIVAVAENIDTWDPGFTVGSKSSQTTIQNTFDQLTQYERVEATAPDGTTYMTVNTGNIIGMLADSMTADGANLVFSLKDGITFHNGDPIDGEAVRNGYERIFESQGVSTFLLTMGGGVSGPEAFSSPDAKTFVMEMSKPNVLIPMNNVMHNTSTLDPAEIEANATDTDPWATEFFRANLGSGNGPYMLESYKPDDSIVLVAAENYYGDTPAFSKVIMRIIADATARVQLLANGDVDFATKVPIKELEGLQANEGVRSLSIPSTLVTMLELNSLTPPFDQKEVRQAVAFATPYQQIIDEIYLGQAQIAKSLVPAGMPTSDFSTNAYEFDLDKAKELLATAGFPEGEGLPEIKFTVRNDDVQWERIAILIQDTLKQIGMNVTIEKMAYAQFNELEQSSQLQMWMDEWISWVNDPFYHMSWLATSSSPTNYPKLNNARVDEIIAEYTLSDDVEARDAASKEAQALIIDECNYVFLCQPNWIQHMRADVDGYVYYNDELPRWYHMSRAEA